MKSHLTKYRVPAACLAAILLAGVAQAIARGAVTTTHYQSRGLTAELGFSSISDSVGTNVTISATQGEGRSPNLVELDIYELDLNSGMLTAHYSAVFYPTSSQLQIRGSLDSASLNVIGLALHDAISGNSVTADVSITWIGSGPTLKARDNSSYEMFVPGGGGIETLRMHLTGMSRQATAAGGIVVNGTDLLAGIISTNFDDLVKSSNVGLDITKSF
jgi:hypothetical protein